MNIKTLLVVLILILSIVGGGIIAYLWFLTPPVVPTTPVQQTTNQQPNGTVSTNPNTQTQTTTPATSLPTVDVAHVYAEAFTKFSATKVEFSAVSSETGPMGDVYALFKQALVPYKKAHPGTATIHVALIDLNGDGVAEALVYLDPPGYCGSGGCSFEIYKKDGKAWKEIFATLTHATIGLLSTKNLGYTDLLLSVEGLVRPSETRLVTYSWNTEEYVEASDVAVWNGTTFLIK